MCFFFLKKLKNVMDTDFFHVHVNFIKVLRYFYFSQSLINLLITGKAVSNVWDNDKEVCGLSKYNYL